MFKLPIDGDSLDLEEPWNFLWRTEAQNLNLN